jgi:hypothetical protein
MLKQMAGTFKRRALVLAALAGAVSMLPIAAGAQTAPQTTHYETAIRAVYGSPYPIAGRLDLESFPNGILRGYYWPQFQKQYIPVAGGRDASYIWFNVGPSSYDLGLGAGPGGMLHFVGTMSADGSFSGQVYPIYTPALSGQAMQTAMGAAPQPTTNDQYTFTATPLAKGSSPQ